ncbi:hypothetical protein GCM10011351_27830 [Paraliobacillus quinghaiensis]|uniref:Uncharacterized protein n=1 Tax=Paraliobacillus quinghaiensis TaxID=470815 RepID=A0A917TVW8_9BACI|nr:SA1362 family protein [Paraliobacillus quinghaiensis]GGM40151.1 hypothetical protein GCM10011351_27830 [Paraliobacillus quinghaiensis]
MFRHRKLSVWIYLIIGLAIFGLGSQLLTNTAAFLTNMLIMVGFTAIIFGAIYFFFFRKRTTNDLKKYRKAVKQSKKKYKNQATLSTSRMQVNKNKPLLNKKKQTNKAGTPNLRVIDGKKTRRKDRASF